MVEASPFPLTAAVREIPRAMKAVVFDAHGGPEVLRVAEIPCPPRISDEVLVRVVAAGVNPVDANTRAGRGVSSALGGFPSQLGFDFSGVVVETPYRAHPFKPGDEVYGMAPFPRGGGSYAEYVSVPTLNLARKPKVLSHVEAAAVPLAALTAWGAVVELAKAHEGQRMLVHAGAGGVGHFAVQFARYFGAYVVSTGSPRNRDWLLELGAHEAIDYTAGPFEDWVADLDVVIDTIGNAYEQTGSRSLQTLRPGGLLVNLPTSSWPTLAEDAEAAGMRASGYKVSPDGSVLAVITRLIESGDVKVYVEEVFDLDEAQAAHERLEKGRTRGKLVLVVHEG